MAPDRSTGLRLNQNVWLSRAALDPGIDLTATRRAPDNGLYLFVIQGDVQANGHTLHARDGLGITGADNITLHAQTRTDLLVIDVPMRRR